MSIAHVAATGEGAWPSRSALTPTLSLRLRCASARQAGERGNFSGVVTMRMSVDAFEPFGQVALATNVYAQPDRVGRRRFGRPRSFLPLPGGEGRGEGESQALFRLFPSRRSIRTASIIRGHSVRNAAGRAGAPSPAARYRLHNVFAARSECAPYLSMQNAGKGTANA